MHTAEKGWIQALPVEITLDTSYKHATAKAAAPLLGVESFFTNLVINEARERDRERERETLKCYLHKGWEINYHPIIAAKNGK